MKKSTRWRMIILLVLTLSPFLGSAIVMGQEDPRTIRLSRGRAIAMAIGNNIDLRVRALDSSLAETDITSSRSIYNPYLTSSLDFSQTDVAGRTYGTETIAGTFGITQNLPTGGYISLTTRTGPISAISDPLYDYTDWSSAIGITYYQPLLKNAGREATELGIAQDTLSFEDSLENFRGDVIQTVFSVISDYNRLYVLYQLLESRREAVSSAQKLLQEIKNQAHSGEDATIALSNSEYALSQRQTEMIEAERQVSSKEASLRYLLGLEEKLHIIPVDPPSRDEPMGTEKEMIALALAEHPDLKGMRIQLESNMLREKVSQRKLWPDLALTANGGYRGYAEDGTFGDTVSQIADRKGEYWGVGARITYPLGNDLAESEYRRNKLRSEQLKNQITAAEWKIRDTIQDDNRSLISARLQLRSTAKSKLLAEQRVAHYQKNRRLGKASVKDLLDAENDLIYARNLELTAVENFAYLVAKLWKDSGVLLERQNIHIDTKRPDLVTGGEMPVSAAELPPELTKLPEAPSQKPVPPKSAPAEPPSTYRLKIGEFPTAQVPSIKKKIASAGLTSKVTDGAKRSQDVTRLLIGIYGDKASAQQALAPLKNTSSEGFILRQGANRYEAFAGSFFSRASAETERKRLANRGIIVSLKDVSVELPTTLVETESFPSREAAMMGLKKLEGQGLNAEIVQNLSQK